MFRVYYFPLFAFLGTPFGHFCWLLAVLRGPVPFSSKCNKEVLFGLPNKAALDEAKEGKIILGGCIVSKNPSCPVCKTPLVD